MAASALPSPPNQTPKFEPNTEKLKQRLIKWGVTPTPKIIHTLRKKQIQKHTRRLNKSKTLTAPKNSEDKTQLAKIKKEYDNFNRAVKAQMDGRRDFVGVPWESVGKVKLKELALGERELGGTGVLKRGELAELRDLLLSDDVEVGEEEEVLFEREGYGWEGRKRTRSEGDAVRFLANRLSEKELSKRDWKFRRMMRLSGLRFTEDQLIKIVEELGKKGSWRQAMTVVDWVYGDKDSRRWKSRFVYTTLIAVLGKARRPHEALEVFNRMRGDCHVYPDMAAYHSIAVTLGQSGLLKELVSIMESMSQKPKKIKNMRKNWDPVLEPDLVIYNAVLNACVPSRQWKGVFWVFQQLRKSGLKPNGATYGLAMEVMLQSRKYDLVHEFFRKMKKNGEASKALTYKVLVRAFWEEGKVNEAVKAVRDMEQRGVVGTASVYYELACCLCRDGRWEDAMVEVAKMKKLDNARPLAVTFTGMILSSMEGGHVNSCLSIFKIMESHCAPNIGTINAMLKVYGKNDMFSEAKELFEDIEKCRYAINTIHDADDRSLIPDEYTYSSMLEASAQALHWEYFEHVYREMSMSGYRLDQNKHGWLLVKASRAGKGYLLEHAFDLLLEAGDIPSSSFFTELILQAICEQNYDRAINLLNSMAYAPFQVGEKEWRDLFIQNADRINIDNLKCLLNKLANCDVTSETTVLMLSKTLHSICGAAQLRNFSGSDVSVDEVNGAIISVSDWKKCNDDAKETMLKFSDSLNPSLDPHYRKADLMSNKHPIIHSGLIGENNSYSGSTSLSKPRNKVSYGCCSTILGFNDGDMDIHGSTNYLEEELTSSNITGTSEDVDGLYLDASIDSNDNSEGPILPSADEILKAWKESRNKDGIFFSFQLEKT